MKIPETLQLNPTACYKAAEQGKEYADAYLFAKSLATLTKHPILFDFKANMTAYRIILKIGEKKYINLLKSAISNGFATLEGKHLRLISKTQERKLFNLKNTPYDKIKRTDLKKYFQIQLIKNNIRKQKKAIVCKQRAIMNKGRYTGAPGNSKYGFLNLNKPVNNNITLSYRSAANILGCSVSYAYKQLKDLGQVGLVITKQRHHIDKDVFRFCLNRGYHNIRYDKKTAKYYFVASNVVEVKPFFNTINNRVPVNTFLNH